MNGETSRGRENSIALGGSGTDGVGEAGHSGDGFAAVQRARARYRGQADRGQDLRDSHALSSISPRLGQSSRDSPALGGVSSASPWAGQDLRDSHALSSIPPWAGQGPRDSRALGGASGASPWAGQDFRDSHAFSSISLWAGQNSRDSHAISSIPGTSPRRGRNQRLGAFGEAEAARYLERTGYRIIERNWVCRDPDLRGELDLIARLRRTLVVFEVKTRSTNHLAHPAEAVTRAKAVRLRRLAVRWLATRRSRPAGQRLIRQTKELRIDVIAIRTRPEQPFAVVALDHLVGVA